MLFSLTNSKGWHYYENNMLGLQFFFQPFSATAHNISHGTPTTNVKMAHFSLVMTMNLIYTYFV